jgi:hypothetical protein
LKTSFVSVLVLLRSSNAKVFSGSQQFFERHGWVMKEATIFSWEDVPTRTTAGVVRVVTATDGQIRPIRLVSVT